MSIFGYFVTYTNYDDGVSRKTHGFVAAESRAEATEIIEEQYDTDWSSIEEIGISNVTSDDDNPAMLDEYQIGFFLDAMRQNGYSEEGK